MDEWNRVCMKQGLQTSESAVVWAKVNEGILNKKWDKANDAKVAIEETEREMVRNRKRNGEAWVPKHFVLSGCKETDDRGWEVKPRNLKVPPAPIVVPF